MSDQPKKPVFCVRNHTGKTAKEHMLCPYCFGKDREVIEEGERKRFCDYDPEEDPVSFGFPDDSSRNAGG